MEGKTRGHLPAGSAPLASGVTVGVTRYRPPSLRFVHDSHDLGLLLLADTHVHRDEVWSFTPAKARTMCGRGGLKEVLFRLLLMHPEITIVWADSVYAGKLVDWAKQHLNLTVKPVSRPKDTSGFVVLPRRWVVERSFAWMMHARRHARDYERLVQHSETLISWAAITLMTRRLARKGAAPRWPRKPAAADG